ncbi:MAG: hypothetical protein HYX85_01190 [Chloroflexi bacterium]|nr:hypothetical protein [Chloroflexota bacterium]
MEVTTTYFETAGKANTDATLRIARRRAEELGIKTIVVSSNAGDTAAAAVDAFRGLSVRIIAVGRAAGWRTPNTQEFTEENRRKVEGVGGAVLIATPGLGGVDRAVRMRTNMTLLGIVASTLTMFCAGVKVVCEIAVMAADSGLIRTDEDAIVIAGTGRGADTAVVLRPANSVNFFDIRVKELLCKPHFPASSPPAPAAATVGAATGVPRSEGAGHH